MLYLVMSEIFNSYKSPVNLTLFTELCEKEGKSVIYDKDEYLLHQGDVERHISLVSPAERYRKFVDSLLKV